MLSKKSAERNSVFPNSFDNTLEVRRSRREPRRNLQSKYSTISHSQTYPSNQTGTKIEDKQPQPETFWESVSGGDALATITSLLVIVGAIQAVLFLGQLKFIREGLVDTKEAVELGRREFNATHRPHLIIRDIVRERENIIYAIVNKGDAEGQ